MQYRRILFYFFYFLLTNENITRLENLFMCVAFISDLKWGILSKFNFLFSFRCSSPLNVFFCNFGGEADDKLFWRWRFDGKTTRLLARWKVHQSNNKFLPSIPKIDPKIKILIEFWQNLAARTAFIFLRVIEMFVMNDDK
jgi:hypothetical protein